MRNGWAKRLTSNRRRHQLKQTTSEVDARHREKVMHAVDGKKGRVPSQLYVDRKKVKQSGFVVTRRVLRLWPLWLLFIILAIQKSRLIPLLPWINKYLQCLKCGHICSVYAHYSTAVMSFKIISLFTIFYTINTQLELKKNELVNPLVDHQEINGNYFDKQLIFFQVENTIIM